MKKIELVKEFNKLDEIPEGEAHMQYISTMTKALDAWADANKKRGFMIIATGESSKDKDGSTNCGMAAFGFGGNRSRLCSLLGVLLQENPDFQKFIATAAEIVKYEAKKAGK